MVEPGERLQVTTDAQIIHRRQDLYCYILLKFLQKQENTIDYWPREGSNYIDKNSRKLYPEKNIKID